MDYDQQKTCGSCALCVRVSPAFECGLTDNIVDADQEACIHYLPEEDPDYEQQI